MAGLPLEIVSCILPYLDRDDLKACSLTSRLWLPLAQALLFRNIEISDPRQCKGFVEFLDRAPHFGRYLQCLEITSLASVRPEFISSYAHLHEVFPNIKSFYLMAHHWSPRWDSLPPSVISSFEAIISSPKLKRLRLDYWKFSETGHDLADLLRQCSVHLKALSLHSVISEDYWTPQDAPEDAPEVKNIHLPNIRELDIAHDGIWTPTGLYRLDAPQLTSLSWQSFAVDLYDLFDVVTFSSLENVEFMSLNFSFDFSESHTDSTICTDPEYLDEAWDLPNVHTLKIEIELYYEYGCIDVFHLCDMLKAISKYITQIPSRTALESIIIIFPDFRTAIEESGWDQFESTLETLHRDGALRSIAMYPPILESRLPKLHSLGIVDVNEPDM